MKMIHPFKNHSIVIEIDYNGHYLLYDKKKVIIFAIMELPILLMLIIHQMIIRLIYLIYLIP